MSVSSPQPVSSVNERRPSQTSPKALYVLNTDTLDLVYSPKEQRALEELADFYAEPQTRESVAANPSILADAEVIFSSWTAPVMDQVFLDHAPNLRAVFYGAGSVRYFTTDAFWDRNILLTSAYAANAEPVAQYTLGVILLSLKKFWHGAAQTRRGDGWGNHTRQVPGCFRTTIGLISFGMIARRTVELLRPFDLNIVVYCPFTSSEDAAKMGVTLCSLEDCFQMADVVSLHTPDLPETRGMVRGEHFRSMKKNATFINTARGAIVREEEMLDALEQRPDLSAVIDVTWPEPPAEDSRFRSLPNVVLTPHIAGSLGPECQRLGFIMLEEFKRYLRNEPLKWGIDRALSAKMA